MSASDRGLLATASVFILIGVLMLALNFVPGANLATLWPLALFVVSLGLLLPLLVWPTERKTLAAFFIPALVLFALGVIFLYDTLSGDWASWAFAWILIPTSVGAGLYLAARFGAWGSAAQKVGVWMALCGIALFALLGLLFGSAAVRIFISILLIVCGILILLPVWLSGKKETPAIKKKEAGKVKTIK
ncbi:hypothetical protein JW992_00635 [candidate division KSB1 bacterium]|nr:hypothetical protein [candidate division KSB1 bacterium]